MPNHQTPLIIEPRAAKQLISNENILVIDLCQAESYIKHHLPGAVFLEYNWLVTAEKPRMGLLPDIEQISRILSVYGINEDTHVIAYDDEGGGRACRFLWTLQCVGHTRISLVNGGLHAWLAEGLALSPEILFPLPLSNARNVQYNANYIADKDYILAQLKNPDSVILDARSEQEHNGSKVFAARGGHIPGAIHYEWTNAMDKNNHLKLKDAEQIKSDLAKLSITPDKNIVCHCQSHHRSAHTCIVLNSLGYQNVKGYPGSWSDWGNDPDTPIE